MKDGLRLTREFLDDDSSLSIRYLVEYVEDGEVWKESYVYLVTTSNYEEMETIRGTESQEKENQIFEYERKEDFLAAGWFDELEAVGIKAF